MKINSKLHKYSGLRSIIVLLIGLGLLPVWMMWQFPLLRENFFTGIPIGLTAKGLLIDHFWGGDHVQAFYIAWKLKQSLLTWEFSPLVDGYGFAAAGEIFYDFHIGVQFLLAALAGMALGDVGGYNFSFFILNLILGFFSAYFLLSQVTDSFFYRVFGAIALAMVPKHIREVFNGHNGGMLLFLYPLYIGAILRHRLSPRSNYWDLAAGFVLFIALISDEHVGFYLLIFSGIVFPIWGIQDFIHRQSFSAIPRLILRWKFLLLGLFAALTYGLTINIMLLSSKGGGPKSARTLWEIAHYSSPLGAFLEPNSYGTVGAIVFWLLPAVLTVACAARLGLVRRAWESPMLPIGIAFVVSMFLMVGVGNNWSQKTRIYEIFYSYLPFFNYQRVPHKIQVLVVTLLVLMCGALLSALRKSSRRSWPRWKHGIRMATCSLIVVGIALQAYAFFRVFHVNNANLYITDLVVPHNSAINVIRGHTTSADIIMTLPVNPGMGRYATFPQYMAYRTERRFAQGYHGAAPVYFMSRLPHFESFNSGEPSRNAIKGIIDLGYTHVLMDLRQLGGLLEEGAPEKLENLGLLDKQDCIDQICLYKINGQNIDLARFHNRGWSGKQTKASYPGRWMLKEQVDLIPGVTEDKLAKFSVVSLVNSNKSASGKKIRVSLDFHPSGDFSMWVIEPGIQSREYTQNSWQERNGLQRLEFLVNSERFYLATQQHFTPVEQGVWDLAKYGHFVTKISFEIER